MARCLPLVPSQPRIGPRAPPWPKNTLRRCNALVTLGMRTAAADNVHSAWSGAAASTQQPATTAGRSAWRCRRRLATGRRPTSCAVSDPQPGRRELSGLLAVSEYPDLADDTAARVGATLELQHPPGVLLQDQALGAVAERECAEVGDVLIDVGGQRRPVGGEERFVGDALQLWEVGEQLPGRQAGQLQVEVRVQAREEGGAVVPE